MEERLLARARSGSRWGIHMCWRQITGQSASLRGAIPASGSINGLHLPQRVTPPQPIPAHRPFPTVRRTCDLARVQFLPYISTAPPSSPPSTASFAAPQRPQRIHNARLSEMAAAKELKKFTREEVALVSCCVYASLYAPVR